MRSRGGEVDALQLARELGAPVAQISAAHGKGLEAVPRFLNRHSGAAVEQTLTLPVIGNAASIHTWAAQVTRRPGYRAPFSAQTSRGSNT